MVLDDSGTYLEEKGFCADTLVTGIQNHGKLLWERVWPALCGEFPLCVRRGVPGWRVLPSIVLPGQSASLSRTAGTLLKHSIGGG